MSVRPLSRRERYRAETRDEAKQIALRQLEGTGTGGLSLNAIAKEMGLTGPALYRYFANRDELLAELVTDAYNELADTITAASAPEPGRSPTDRFRALAGANRDWALRQPHRYRLLFMDPAGSGRVLGAERVIPAASRAMAAILDTLLGLAAEKPTRREYPELDRQLEDWSHRREGPDVPGPIARMGVLVWTRLHGVLSLEIEGHFEPMGFDPALLYASEVDALLAEAA